MSCIVSSSAINNSYSYFDYSNELILRYFIERYLICLLKVFDDKDSTGNDRHYHVNINEIKTAKVL